MEVFPTLASGNWHRGGILPSRYNFQGLLVSHDYIIDTTVFFWMGNPETTPENEEKLCLMLYEIVLIVGQFMPS